MEQAIIELDNTFLAEIKMLIKQARMSAYQSVNVIMIETNWKIGKRIVEQEQNGQSKAEYGKRIIDLLSNELTLEFGQGYSSRYLRSFRQFYLLVPDFEIWKSRFPNLTWTHIFKTLRVKDQTAIRWYLETASVQMWTTSTLDRNISTQLYERHYQQPKILDTQIPNNEKIKDSAEFIKSPIIAEFLGFSANDKYSETDLETAILNHLQEFLMEMGRGFAFMYRQYLVRTSARDYFIDLVFYNVILKCYVLVDLKVGRITHQDVGQMDMYVRMFDELQRTEGDNPTIGIVLCSETDEDIARYSILKGNEQLFATKYQLYMPTQEQLRREIEIQKQLFEMQHS